VKASRFIGLSAELSPSGAARAMRISSQTPQSSDGSRPSWIARLATAEIHGRSPPLNPEIQQPAPPGSLGSVTVKIDPFPYSLSTRMSPPIIWQNLRESAKPSPVPPYFFEVLASA
jgi:hypothetical protein